MGDSDLWLAALTRGWKGMFLFPSSASSCGTSCTLLSPEGKGLRPVQKRRHRVEAIVVGHEAPPDAVGQDQRQLAAAHLLVVRHMRRERCAAAVDAGAGSRKSVVQGKDGTGSGD